MFYTCTLPTDTVFDRYSSKIALEPTTTTAKATPIGTNKTEKEEKDLWLEPKMNGTETCQNILSNMKKTDHMSKVVTEKIVDQIMVNTDMD